MLSREQIQRGLRMLDAGASLKEVAKELGTSTSTAGRISTGVRGLDNKIGKRRKPRMPLATRGPKRCPTCGALITRNSCLECQMQLRKDIERITRPKRRQTAPFQKLNVGSGSAG
jgi:hypothetical protein